MIRSISRHMLRVTPIESDDHLITMRLEGRVSGPWVGELQSVCEKALADSHKLLLNLADVSFLDHAGIKLLKALQARGVDLVECSFFVKEQLKTASLSSLESGPPGQSLLSE